MRENQTIRYVTGVAIILLHLVAKSAAAQAPNAKFYKGEWSSLSDWPVLPIHSIVSSNGELLTFGAVPGGSATGVGGKDYDVWNPLTNTHTTLPQVNHDYFCSATVTMPDSGDIMIAGGDDFVPGSTGIDLLTFFNPPSNSLTGGSPMHTPRWYPTATVLSNGDVLVTGGTIQSFSDNVHAITPEIYNTDTGWKELIGATSSTVFGQQTRFWYPRVWAAPNGKAFGIAQDLMFWLDPDANNGNGNINVIGQLPSAYRGRATSSAVMFEPGKILQIGGGGKTNVDSANGLNSALIIDISGNTPILTPASNMNYRRHWANSTVLPNGNVLVNGGSRVNNKYTDVAFTSEIWDPATDQWTDVAAESTPRLYHASSVLLPDGRVFSGGGGNPGPATQHNAQFYTPSYLFNSDGSSAIRPNIEWAQPAADYNTNIQTVVGTGQTIVRVTLVRSSSTTHSFNMDQRFTELNFTQSGQTLQIQTPSSNLIAPPGYYLLSVIDNEGVASESRILKIGDYYGTSGDADEDDIPDNIDNCPIHSNNDQADIDEDGIGDACDPTDDRDIPVEFCNGEEVTVNMAFNQSPTFNADVILGTPDADIITAMGGNDTICALGGNDIINGGNGNDWIDAGTGDDTVDGGNNNDTIFGNDGIDTLNGGPGDDDIFGENDDDLIKGNSGNDTIDGGDGIDQIIGGSGNDVIFTGSGGNLGTNFVVDGGAGNDTITGGSGNDLIRSATGNDTIYGGAGNDELFGGGGNDTVYGQDGNDIIKGNGSKDTLYGGNGDDNIDGGSDIDTLFGGNDNDTLAGATGNDAINGGPGNDILRGGGGNDILNGNRGDDELFGGGSNDTLIGGGDSDDCDGEGGVDTASSCESTTDVP